MLVRLSIIAALLTPLLATINFIAQEAIRLPFDVQHPTFPAPEASNDLTTFDLFLRPFTANDEPSRFLVNVQYGMLSDGCVPDPLSPIQANYTSDVLVFVPLASVLSSNCWDLVTAVKAYDAWASSVGGIRYIIVAFYGTLDNLYDTAGPYVRTVYTAQNVPTTRAFGIAVAPMAIIKFQQVMATIKARTGASDPLVLGYLERVPGPWNEMMMGGAFNAVRALFVAVFVLAALLGLSHSIRLWLHVIRAGGIRSIPTGYLRPDVGTLMRASSVYCLLAWAIFWQYRNAYAYERAIYFSTYFVVTTAFGAMMIQWAYIVYAIRPRLAYRLLIVFVVFSLAVSGVTLFMRAWNYAYPNSPGLTKSTVDALLAFFMGPILVIVSAVFAYYALEFLRFIKRETTLVAAVASLRKVSVLGVLSLVFVVMQVVLTILSILPMSQSVGGYLFFLIATNLLWLVVNSSVFFILRVRLPTSDNTNNELDFAVDPVFPPIPDLPDDDPDDQVDGFASQTSIMKSLTLNNSRQSHFLPKSEAFEMYSQHVELSAATRSRRNTNTEEDDTREILRRL
jgi:hypothetical protein